MPIITDDEAMQVDAAVSKLIKRNKAMGRAVVLYYFNKKNLTKVAQSLNLNRTQANVFVKSGIAWLDASLMHLIEEKLFS